MREAVRHDASYHRNIQIVHHAFYEMLSTLVLQACAAAGVPAVIPESIQRQWMQQHATTRDPVTHARIPSTAAEPSLITDLKSVQAFLEDTLTRPHRNLNSQQLQELGLTELTLIGPPENSYAEIASGDAGKKHRKHACMMLHY